MSKRPTSRDVARLAGVAQATVSRAMSGAGPVNEATRKRVLEAAQQLGYQPNAAAASFNSGKFGCVALLTGMDVTRSLTPTMTMRAIDSALAEHGMHLTLAQVTDEKLSDERFVPKILKSRMADGLLITYNARIPPTMRRLIAENRLPSVWLNSDQPTDCVRPDDWQAGHLAAEVLLGKGHRRIVFIEPGLERRNGVVAPQRLHYSVAERVAGYQSAMADAGLTAQTLVIEIKQDSTEHLVQIGELLNSLGRPDAPTACVIHNQALLGSFAMVASQLGYHIPKDLSLITFINEFRPAGTLPADAIQLPDAELGRVAVELLVEKIRSVGDPTEPRLLPVKYVPGLTCRAAAGF